MIILVLDVEVSPSTKTQSIPSVSWRRMVEQAFRVSVKTIAPDVELDTDVTVRAARAHRLFRVAIWIARISSFFAALLLIVALRNDWAIVKASATDGRAMDF